MIFTTEIRVPYGDTDRMGIVYHVNYIKYFETGRTEMLREINYPYAELERRGIMLPVIECGCTYKSPAMYDDVLKIQTKLNFIKGAKINLSYEILRKKTEETLVTGFTELAIVDLQSRPIILRRKFPELYDVLMEIIDDGKNKPELYQ